MGSKRRHANHDPERGPSIKKAKKDNDSPDIVDKALESGPSVSLGTEEDTPSVLGGSKGSTTEADTTLETGIETPNPSEPLMDIHYFEQCLSWIVDLDLSSFRFYSKYRPKLMEYYTKPDGEEVKQESEILKGEKFYGLGSVRMCRKRVS